MEISNRIRIHMTAHGFWLTVYISRIYGLHRIYAVSSVRCISGTVYDTDHRFRNRMTIYGFQQAVFWCRVRFPATAVSFALFGQVLFSRLFLLSSSFASLFYCCICFAFILNFISGYGSWTPFCTEKGLFLVFLAWSRPSSLTIHCLV